MDEPSGQPSLLLRPGGASGLARAIDRRYEQLLADDYLGEYFMGVDIDRLKTAQLGFLRTTFGDAKASYLGAPLRQAHHDQLVTQHAFDQFVDMFVTAAREAGADDADQTEIRGVLKSLRASVITEFKPNPAYDYHSKPFRPGASPLSATSQV
jgi:truncated hemoglobin YjbI